jgi:hypothetical protein
MSGLNTKFGVKTTSEALDKRLEKYLGGKRSKDHVTVTEEGGWLTVNRSSSGRLDRFIDRVKAMFSSTEQEKNKRTIENFYKTLVTQLGVDAKQLKKTTSGILGDRHEKGRPLSGRRAVCIAQQAVMLYTQVLKTGWDIPLSSLTSVPFSEATRLKQGKDFVELTTFKDTTTKSDEDAKKVVFDFGFRMSVDRQRRFIGQLDAELKKLLDKKGYMPDGPVKIDYKQVERLLADEIRKLEVPIRIRYSKPGLREIINGTVSSIGKVLDEKNFQRGKMR